VRPSHGFRSRAALAASSLFSLTLHAAAAMLVIAWGRSELGVLQQPTEAISIELMASAVLEQAVVDLREVQSGAMASAAREAGAATENAAPAAVSEVKPVETDETEPELDEVAPPAPPTDVEVETVTASESVIAGAAESEDSLPPPPASKAKEQPKEKRTERRPEKQRHAEKPAERTPKEVRTGARPSKIGGAPSRASSPSAAGAGRASASTGDIMGYAARVRARVAGNRPSGRGQRGTAVVSFGVSRSGGLTYVRLSRSSGASALDQAAVAAVRRSAPFPPPPAGAPASRLAFSVPFHFR
jgi:protein TonB